MLILTYDDLFALDAQALVNPVNTKGIMGAGLAKVFKERFPKNYIAYRSQCKQQLLEPGGLFAYSDEKLILNVATKDDWKNPSLMAYVRTGLMAIRHYCTDNEVNSLALTPLGCGLGGLAREPVVSLITHELSQLETKVYLCLKKHPSKS